MSLHPDRQPAFQSSTVQTDPGLQAVTDSVRFDFQLLHHEIVVALEPPTLLLRIRRQSLRGDFLLFVDFPLSGFRTLGAGFAVLSRSAFPWLVGLRIQAARLDFRLALEVFPPPDLRFQLLDPLLSLHNKPQQGLHQRRLFRFGYLRQFDVRLAHRVEFIRISPDSNRILPEENEKLRIVVTSHYPQVAARWISSERRGICAVPEIRSRR
jgi:hypothetical protein